MCNVWCYSAISYYHSTNSVLLPFLAAYLLSHILPAPCAAAGLSCPGVLKTRTGDRQLDLPPQRQILTIVLMGYLMQVTVCSANKLWHMYSVVIIYMPGTYIMWKYKPFPFRVSQWYFCSLPPHVVSQHWVHEHQMSSMCQARDTTCTHWVHGK